MRFVKPFINVYKAIGGWQSQMIAWFPEDEMWDVVQTGFGPYATKEQAEADARSWSIAEEIPCKWQ